MVAGQVGPNNERNRQHRALARARRRAGGDARPSSAQQKLNRRNRLLAAFGDGVTAPCCVAFDRECPGIVDAETMSIDRWPVAGEWGGTYDFHNSWPACRLCNSRAPHTWPRMVPLWAVVVYALREYRNGTGGQWPMPVQPVRGGSPGVVKT
jgi:hypothetical protein